MSRDSQCPSASGIKVAYDWTEMLVEERCFTGSPEETRWRGRMIHAG